MSIKLSRRNFLRNATALAGTVSASNVFAPAANAESKITIPLTDLYGPAPGIAKLNANENPYGPSEAAVKAAQLATTRGAYYVDKSTKMLIDMIAERHGLAKEQITLSSGSSGGLTWLAMAMAKKGKILGPDLFWDTTAQACERTGGEPILHAPKTQDLGIDLDAIYSMIDDNVGMVHITNPNNPTGMLLDKEKLIAFCKKASHKTLVLVDEAYNEVTEFTEQNSVIPLIKAGHNIVVARTFSKIYGLAGMRVGYLIGSPDTIDMINKFGAGLYTLNQAGVAAAVASYNDLKFLDFCRSKINEAKGMVYAALKENGLNAPPSQTNFVFVNLGNKDAELFRQNMEKQNVLIRGIYRDYTHWSRVSVGHLSDVEMYVKALPKALDMTPDLT